ncbi:hypothetical protein C8Q76DRAFT_726504 [Earliella scabrosa]|nr:hypothetical protein C8Q76DRAFT_726504 [Earliella scabrosa]
MSDDADTSHPRIDSDSTCETQRASDICGGCWKGVIANQLGLLQVPVKSDEQLSATDWEPLMGGYVYKVSQEEIEHNAKQGCRWCDLMCRWGSSSMRKPSVTKSENIVEIRVGYSDHAKTCLRVTVNDSEDLLVWLCVHNGR